MKQHGPIRLNFTDAPGIDEAVSTCKTYDCVQCYKFST